MTRTLTGAFLALCLSLSFVLPTAVVLSGDAQAQAQLPSYASGGNLQSEVERKGRTFTEILLAVAVVILILGIIWGAMTLSANPDKGKQIIGYSVSGLIVCAVVYGIAAIAIA